MPNQCNGICQKYGKSYLSPAQRGSLAPAEYLRLYKLYRRCGRCEITMLGYAGVWCPCCGNRLRTKPRDNKTRKRLAAARLALAEAAIA